MARLAFDPLGPPARSSASKSMIDLDRLLQRLQQTVLRADAERERRLRNSEYERQKIGFNIDYARALLAKLEQETISVKVLTRKQETQTELKRKREILEHVMDRMKDLEETSAHADDDDEGTSSEGDDILHDIIMTPSDSMDSTSTDLQSHDNMDEMKAARAHEASQPLSTQALAQEENERLVETLDEDISEKRETVTSQTLRPRGKQSMPADSEKQSQEMDTAQTTGAKSLLLGNRSKEVSDVATSEAILDHQRREQEEVTEDLLRMASQLKLSSQKFGTALQEDTEVLNKAGEGLSKNELSLESAARRMGAITRMTEGKGWYGRIMLYAWIYGLMVVLILVVFVLPKLRF